MRTFVAGNLHPASSALPLQPEAAAPGLRCLLHRPQRRLLHPRDGRHQEVPRYQPERQGPLIDCCSSPYVIETLGVLSSRRRDTRIRVQDTDINVDPLC